MTVSTSVVKHLYNGDGADKTFDFSFRILSSADLLVQLKNETTGALTTKTLTTHYTVSGVGHTVGRTNYSSGTVTFITAPTTAQIVVIGLDVEILQDTDYVENDVFPAEAHEEALDKLTLISQQINEELGRSLKFDSGTTIDGTITVGSDQALKYLRVNSLADALEFVAVTAVGGGIQGVVEDPGPVLGGDLTVDGYDIVGPVTITGATTTAAISSTTIAASGLITANANLDVKNGASAGATIKAYEDSDNGTNYVGLKAPDSLAASTTYLLPSADGTSGQYLQTNGSATLSFSTVTSVSAATQAEQETGTSTTVYVTPGRQHYHDSAAKFWVSFNSAGTIGDSFNTTSITDSGTGQWSVNVATDFSSINWSCHACGGSAAVSVIVYAVTDRVAGSCEVYGIRRDTGAVIDPIDPDSIWVCGFGDQ